MQMNFHDNQLRNDSGLNPSSTLSFPSPSALTAAANPSDGSFSPCDADRTAPLLSLFDTLVLKRDFHHRNFDLMDNPAIANWELGTLYENTNARLLKSIKNDVPNVRDLTHILEFSRDSWRMWRNVFPEDLGLLSAELDGLRVGNIRDFIYRSLNTDNVAIVVKVILCLAVHLQQLPRDFDYSECTLQASSEDLQNHYMRFVDRFLDRHDGVVATLEGVECLMIQAEFYINVGKPKRIWSIFRRAVNCAQLLGLHRPSQDARRRALWSQIWQRDRELSLVLGLPYAVSEPFLASSSTVAGQLEEKFLAQLGIVTGHVIERDQNHGQTNYHTTSNIALELDECKDLMPEGWWAMIPSTDVSDDTLFMASVMKMKYHNTRKLLHLPFLLKSYEDSRYGFSRATCLESARQMIRIYRTMRDEGRPLLKMCDMMDFQAFTATMVFVVELLGHSQVPVHRPPQQDASDWDIVNGIIQDFKRVSRTMVCSVAEQAAQLLQDFYSSHHSHTASRQPLYEATIPYFGKLRIARNPGIVPHATSKNTIIEPPRSPEPTTHSFDVDPLVDFEAYDQTLPWTLQPWQDLEADCTFDLGLGDDWSWLPQGTKMQ